MFQFGINYFLYNNMKYRSGRSSSIILAALAKRALNLYPHLVRRTHRKRCYIQDT